MPGLVGCISLTGRQQPDISQVLIQPLLHEPDYRVHAAHVVNGVASAIGPGFDERLAGVSFDAESQVCAAFYGQFFNADFQGTDTGTAVAAVLVRLYLKHGDTLPGMLDGSFVLFIADGRNQAILIANDHCATRPLFYIHGDGFLGFSPETKGLADLPGADRSIDPVALVSFLSNGHLLYDQTFYQQVRPLLPGHTLTVRDGRLTLRNYCPYAPDGNVEDRGEAAYVGEFAPLLMNAMEKRLGEMRHTIFPLSGGMDSRGLLGCAAKLFGHRLTTVTWGYDETVEGTDGWVARKVANHLGTNHSFVRRDIGHLTSEIHDMLARTDGLTDDAAFHHNELPILRAVFREHDAHYLVRGEEFFGHWKPARNDVEALALSDVHEMHEYEIVRAVVHPDLVSDVGQRSLALRDAFLGHCPVSDFTDRRDYYYFYQRLFHYHTRCAYFKYTFLDVLSPWLDKDIFTYLQHVPVHYRLERRLYRKALEQLIPDLMTIPLAWKEGLEDWPAILEEDSTVQAFVRHHLLDSQNRLHGYLNTPVLQSVIAGAFAGSHRPSLKRRVVSSAKAFLRTAAPQLYDRLKPAAMKRLPASDLPTDLLIFRLLVLKLWFDRYGPR